MKYKKIPLTKGYFALVDAEDYDRVMKHGWCYMKARTGRDGYAMATIRCERALLHRFILGIEKGKVVDHINRNGLDCRRKNLRICSQSENRRNSSGKINTSSSYKGVSWHKASKKWSAQIQLDGKKFYLGVFETELAALRAYRKKARELFGAFFPPGV